MTNILLRPAPAGDFQIETLLTFEPDQNHQFAGLVIYQDNNNFIQAGQAYCRGGGCVSRGIYMNHYGKGLIVPPNFAQVYKNNVVVLRLVRKGTSYIFEISGDGKVFYKVGSHESDMTPLQIGVLAGQNVDGISTTVPAVFDYFEVSSP
jgi:beta-xylosidase